MFLMFKLFGTGLTEPLTRCILIANRTFLEHKSGKKMPNFLILRQKRYNRGHKITRYLS